MSPDAGDALAVTSLTSTPPKNKGAAPASTPVPSVVFDESKARMDYLQENKLQFDGTKDPLAVADLSRLQVEDLAVFRSVVAVLAIKSPDPRLAVMDRYATLIQVGGLRSGDKLHQIALKVAAPREEDEKGFLKKLLGGNK